MHRMLFIAPIVVTGLLVIGGCSKPAEQKTISAPPDAVTPAASQPEPPPATAEKTEPQAKEEGSACKVEGEEGKPVKTAASGLKYVVLDEGTGPRPKRGDKVTAEYTGWLTDGAKFDSSKDRPGAFSFRVGVGKVIPAWDEAVLDMKVGERRKLIAPPDLAYGPEGTPDGAIPPNATLVFEVKLVKINK